MHEPSQFRNIVASSGQSCIRLLFGRQSLLFGNGRLQIRIVVVPQRRRLLKTRIPAPPSPIGRALPTPCLNHLRNTDKKSFPKARVLRHRGMEDRPEHIGVGVKSRYSIGMMLYLVTETAAGNNGDTLRPRRVLGLRPLKVQLGFLVGGATQTRAYAFWRE